MAIEVDVETVLVIVLDSDDSLLVMLDIAVEVELAASHIKRRIPGPSSPAWSRVLTLMLRHAAELSSASPVWTLIKPCKVASMSTAAWSKSEKIWMPIADSHLQ